MPDKSSDKLRYEKRGISASKKDVHTAIAKLNKGLFPRSFCKILPDYLGNDRRYCNIMHTDGAGTKSSLAYIYWKETGDLSVWKGIAQDAVIMNVDDLLCVGAIDDMLLSSAIGRNGLKIPAEVIATIIEGTEEILKKLRNWGINIHLAGGETADVGDLVKTVIVDASVSCRMKRADVITSQGISHGDVIVGLASDRQASYENCYNSGIGSNGLTAVRHDLFHREYAKKYPETYDDALPEKLVYSGSFKVTDKLPKFNTDMGKFVLSPTRSYAPVLKEILAKHHPQIRSIIHCTGGGQTKILHVIDSLKIVKNNLFPTPYLFRLIQKTSQTPWREMYQVFNMGHRLELIVSQEIAQDIIRIVKSYNIDAQQIGYCESNDRKVVEIHSPYGKFSYS